MAATEHYQIPLPDPTTEVDDEFYRLQQALAIVDAVIWALASVVADKANANHSQAMSTINGLVDALAGKMPASQTFSLDDLTDVTGASGAAVNYVLVKNASGQWVPSSAIAALGIHQHPTTDIVGLTAAINAAVAAVVNAAPATLDTLKEIATALGNDANFSTTITNLIAQKLALSGGTLTGVLNWGVAAFYSKLAANGDILLSRGNANGDGFLTWNKANAYAGFDGTRFVYGGAYELATGGALRVGPTGSIVYTDGNIEFTGGMLTAFGNSLYNALITIPKRYVSAQQVITQGSTITLAHGLGVVPSMVVADLVCITAQGGYVPGEITQIGISMLGVSGITPGAYGVSIDKTTTNIVVRIPIHGLTMPNKAANDGTTINGVIPANWRIVVRAFS